MLVFLFIQSMISDISASYSGTTLTVNGFGILKGVRFNKAFEPLNVGTIETFSIEGDIYQLSPDAMDRIGDVNYTELFLVKHIKFKNVEAIPNKVFGYIFNNVESVDFGSKMRYIGYNFFNSPLSFIKIPATVERIDPAIFRVISSFELDQNNPYYTTCTSTDTQYLLYKNRSTIFAVAGPEDGIDFKPPDCITVLDTINPSSSDDLIIKSIDLNKVEVIKGDTFQRCTFSDSLTNINISGIKRLESGSLSMFSSITRFPKQWNISKEMRFRSQLMYLFHLEVLSS